MIWWTLRQLKSKKTKTFVKAAHNAGESRDSRTVEPLIAALKQGDREVRYCAALALRHFADKPDMPPVNRSNPYIGFGS